MFVRQIQLTMFRRTPALSLSYTIDRGDRLVCPPGRVVDVLERGQALGEPGVHGVPPLLLSDRRRPGLRPPVGEQPFAGRPRGLEVDLDTSSPSSIATRSMAPMPSGPAHLRSTTSHPLRSRNLDAASMALSFSASMIRLLTVSRPLRLLRRRATLRAQGTRRRGMRGHGADWALEQRAFGASMGWIRMD